MLRVLIPPELSPALRIHGPPAGPLQQFGGESMGTTWSVKLATPTILPPTAIQEDLQHTLDVVVEQMSSWRTDSALSRFNRAPALSWHNLPEEFFTVLSCGLQIARDTAGAYDPTIGSLTRLWGFGPQAARCSPPSTADIAAAKNYSGWQQITLDAESRSARQSGNIELDLCGIAKGFAVDQLAEYLTNIGIDHYLVEVGGELRGRGCKPDGSPWWVALEQPEPASSLEQTMAALHDISVATSGDYRRYFEHEGRRYSHTLDPRSGYPTDTGIMSVTVFHPSCMRADALATALTVLGLEQGAEYARNHDVAALFLADTPRGILEHLTPTLTTFLSHEE